MIEYGYMADNPINPTSHEIAGGITMRQYAAIHLKVPNSGLDWLDDMIRQSLRDDFAAKAMQTFVSKAPQGSRFGVDHADTNNNYSLASYAMADAMLSARDGAK